MSGSRAARKEVSEWLKVIFEEHRFKKTDKSVRTVQLTVCTRTTVVNSNPKLKTAEHQRTNSNDFIL